MKLNKKGEVLVDEMSIVDVFTRLIFDADCDLGTGEQQIVELLRQQDDALVGSCRRDIGEYLRAMGVDEMITVVNRIKHLLDQQRELVVTAPACDSPVHPLQ